MKHKTLPSTPGRTFFVGDLHGRHAELLNQLNELGFDFNADRLICTGDLIDRGPETVECLGLLLQPWFHSVLGNHEKFFIEAEQDTVSRELHESNGGEWTWDLPDPVLHLMRDLVRQYMPVTLTTTVGDSQIGVVHATALSSWQETIESVHTNHLVWDFTKATRAKNGETIEPIGGVNAVVSGHCGVDKIICGGNHLWIDTWWSTKRFSIISANQALAMTQKPA